MMITQTWVLLLGAYLLGSIPTAYVMVQWVTGEDIRGLGDGNVGAKNTYHIAGKAAGVSVAILDIGKGALGVILARYLTGDDLVTLLAGACVVIGHDFSIFLKFRGGQGMAASIGVFFGLFPQITLVAFGIFLVCMAVTRNWDLSCGIALALLVLTVWLTEHSPPVTLYSMLLLISIGIRKFLQNISPHNIAV
jgi:glycerol-3-phosphate acyltransferase PlsY